MILPGRSGAISFALASGKASPLGCVPLPSITSKSDDAATGWMESPCSSPTCPCPSCSYRSHLIASFSVSCRCSPSCDSAAAGQRTARASSYMVVYCNAHHGSDTGSSRRRSRRRGLARAAGPRPAARHLPDRPVLPGHRHVGGPRPGTARPDGGISRGPDLLRPAGVQRGLRRRSAGHGASHDRRPVEERRARGDSVGLVRRHDDPSRREAARERSRATARRRPSSPAGPTNSRSSWSTCSG